MIALQSCISAHVRRYAARAYILKKGGARNNRTPSLGMQKYEVSLKLTKRLALIASYIEKDSNVIDVGTDHGLIPVYLAQNDIAKNIIAADINEAPLDAARKNAAKYNVQDKIKFVMTSGLDGIGREVDTVVIAGMGGENIAGILQNTPWLKLQNTKLILQPQTRIEILCRWLGDNGYNIRDAALTHESSRFYIVIIAGVCISDTQKIYHSEIDLYSLLVKKRDPFIESFLDDLIIKTKKTAGNSSKFGSNEFLKKFNELLKLKEECLNCQK